ncbi:MAG: methyltransferase domain-containing protein, partial [Sedimenticola sp.]
MRHSHFETLKPICPRCRSEWAEVHPLLLARVLHEDNEGVHEGVLHCSNPNCQLEYPIIDGIPIIVPNVRAYLSDNLYHLTARNDLSETVESILGDSSAPDALYNRTRQYLSTYTWDNYADLAPDAMPEGTIKPGAVKRCLDAGLALLDETPPGPVIDIGCAVGRSSFELAANGDQLVLGVDTNFSMLHLAQGVLADNRVRYPRRRTGIVYDRQEFEVKFDHARQVDFWACDGLALPFADNSFGLAVGLHVLDSVSSPRELLESIGRVLQPGGSTIIATPYDWSAVVTPIEAWIGGHSQR